MSEPVNTDDPQSGMPLRVVEALKWLLATLGISSILLAIGFINDFAYQDRLGYRLSSTEDILGYSLEAGRFLVSVVTLVLNWLFAPLRLLAFVSAVAAASLIVFAWSRYVQERSRRASYVSAILLLGLFGVEIILFDIPTFNLRGALVRPLSSPGTLNDDWLAGRLAREFWEDEICSRLEVPQYPKIRNILDDEKMCRSTPSEHRQRRESRFVMNLLLTVGLLILALRLIVSKQASFSSYVLPGLLMFLSLVDLLLLPYSHAKTVRATTADDVIVTWRAEQHEGGDEPSADESGTIAAESVPEEGMDVHFNLLYKRDDEVVLFERSEGNIWVIPKDLVRLLRIVNERDVVKSLIRARIDLDE